MSYFTKKDKTRGIITLVPLNGIGNRISALASAKALSEKINSRLEVVWIKSRYELNANFQDIFMDIENIKIKNLNNSTLLNRMISKWWYSRSHSKIIYFINNKLYDMVSYDEDLQGGVFNERHKYSDLKGKKVLFKSYSPFYSKKDLSFSFIKPSKSLVNKINEITSDFTNLTLGIHVRRTDKIMSIENSPDNLFFEEIERRIEENSSLNLYLSTDCKQTEDLFLKRYGKRIIFYENKILCRDSKRGIQDSAIDLFVLSKTSEILGSYRSSFSIIASKIGNIPKKTMKV